MFSRNQFRDFLYIDDLIELIFACLKKKLDGQIFNVEVEKS